MRQSYRNLVWAALLLATTGCASTRVQSTMTNDSRSAAGEAAKESIVGTWFHGQDRLTLSEDGTYAWEMSMTCEIPPCPVSQQSGTYSRDQSTIHLETLEGPLLLKFHLKGDPIEMELHCETLERDWSLSLKE